MKHARLNPSSAARWSTCTASVAALEALDLPYSSSEAADEGTFAHRYLELLLNNRQPATWAKGSKGNVGSREFIVTDEMVEHLQTTLDYIRPFITENTEAWTERAIPLWYSPDENGYCDVSMYRPEDKSLHIFDFKYGWGFVEVEKNEQFRIYAASLYEELITEFYEIESIHCHVCQPRVNNFACETLTVDELEEFMVHITEQVDIIRNHPDKCTFVASEKACQWCDLGKLGKCKAQAQQAVELIQCEFDEFMDENEPVLVNLDILTPREIAHIYRNAGTVETFLKQIKARAQELAEHGDLPGYKRVMLQGNRTWTNEDEAVKFMLSTLKLKKGKVFPPKPLTPPQLEKVVNVKTLSTRARNRLDNLITRPEKPIVVPVSDKRDALPVVADEFDAIETTSTEVDEFDF